MRDFRTISGRILVLLLLLPFGCREKFVPSLQSPPTGYLVVEGILNDGDGPTNILLSRTNPFNADTLRFETGAVVRVEGDDNSVFGLTETQKGVYSVNDLHLNQSQQYRLYIKTLDGKEYMSEYVPVKSTPAIDTVSWRYGDDGVNFSVSTHDPNKNTRYYYWRYEEAWEFHVPYVSTLKWDTQTYGNAQHLVVLPIQPDYSKIVCWPSAASTSVMIASSNKLSADIIQDYPIAVIPKGSEKLAYMYSMIVRQYALTLEAYEFLQKIKKNTEKTGSIFDPQPSELKGNIHSVNDPSEIVLGFVSASTEQSKRIFIKANEIPNWGYQYNCGVDSVDQLGGGSYLSFQMAKGFNLVPIDILIKNHETGEITAFTASDVRCVDCTLKGTNVKPPYWP